MEIVKACKDDIKAISILEGQRFIDAWNEKQWQYEILNNEFSTTLLLKDDNKLIGYINYWILFDQATINKVCIDEAYTHQGLGNKILISALNNIDQALCISTSLEVRVSNLNAIKLYQKNKFKTAVQKKAYYSDGEDCYYMLRSIGDKYE